MKNFYFWAVTAESAHRLNCSTMSKNQSHLSARKGLDDNLFERIARLAAENGDTPDKEALRALAEEFLIGEAALYGTTTFYDFLKPENRAKEVYLCDGSSCLCAGTQQAVKRVLRKHFAEEQIGHMTCLGRCHENAAFQYRGKNYSGLSEREIDELLSSTASTPPKTGQYLLECSGTEILTAPDGEADYWRQVLRDVLDKTPEAWNEQVKLSGLRGRGGAGFPIGIKLETCRKAEGLQRYIVCNADEGDPAAFTDRFLLEERPYKVLLGMMLAGYAAGASRGILYIRGEYPESITAIQRAIEEMEKSGCAGEGILDTDFDFHFKIIKAQGAYICGEETALLASIEGQRPVVRTRPPYPVEQGLFLQPTVVNNVETLANLPYIALHGGAAFRQIGTEQSTGTKLLSLDSGFARPGVYEVPMGTPLSVLVNELAGGFSKPVKALHIGGPLGGLVPLSMIPELTIDFESFSEKGFLLGHASILCVPENMPMVQYLEHLFDFTAKESCGKCFPCRLGSVRGRELLQKAQTEGYRIDPNLFDDLLDTLERGSLCALGGGMPLPVRNALQYFEEELRAYGIT